MKPRAQPRYAALGVTCLILAVILLTFAYWPATPDVARSPALGAGGVVLSTATTVLVAGLCARAEAAVTVPAFALLYFLKVLVMLWLGLMVTPPPWWQPLAGAIAAAVCVLLSIPVLAAFAAAAARRVAPVRDERGHAGRDTNDDQVKGDHHDAAR